MTAPRIRKAHNESEFEAVVDDFHTQGYEAVDRGEQSVMMRKKQWGTLAGHVVVFFLTVWWTAGLGNLIYALIARYGTAEQVLIRLEDHRSKGYA